LDFVRACLAALLTVAAVGLSPARAVEAINVRTDAQAIENSTSLEIRGAIDELPNEQRRVIELAYFGGFTHAEIASMLDAPLGTVKGRMRLGLHKLRDQLQGWETVGA